MHAIKNHFPFEFWNEIFFWMTNCSYQYTSCITEDSKEINQCFLKHLHTAIVLLHFVGQISRNSCIPIKWIYDTWMDICISIYHTDTRKLVYFFQYTGKCSEIYS